MNDLISRQAAIDEIEYELEMINSALDSITLDFNTRERLQQRRGEAKEILNSMQQLPSAQQWIPCSERMPEEETDVIVCNANGDIQISRGSHSTEIKDYFILYTTGWRFGEVIAWMPLPKPYKEDKNG